MLVSRRVPNVFCIWSTKQMLDQINWGMENSWKFNPWVTESKKQIFMMQIGTSVGARKNRYKGERSKRSSFAGFLKVLNYVIVQWCPVSLYLKWWELADLSRVDWMCGFCVRIHCTLSALIQSHQLAWTVFHWINPLHEMPSSKLIQRRAKLKAIQRWQGKGTGVFGDT